MKKIPKILKEFVRIEEKCGYSEHFFKYWISMLKDRNYGCPTSGYKFKNSLFMDSDNIKKATNYWSRVKDYLDKDCIVEWIIERFEEIIEVIHIEKENIKKTIDNNEIPDIVNRMIEIEKEYEQHQYFYIHWITLLEKEDYSCPETSYRFYVKYDDPCDRKKVVDVYRKMLIYLKYDYICEWFINELKDIILKKILKDGKGLSIKRPNLYDLYKKEREKGYVSELIVKCSKCNNKMNIMNNTLYCGCDNPYLCPICKKYYCFNCMSHIDIGTGGLGYTHGKSHWYHLNHTCIPCLEKDFVGVLKKVVTMEIEQHY